MKECKLAELQSHEKLPVLKNGFGSLKEDEDLRHCHTVTGFMRTNPLGFD
jgi:hypothetical protein